MNKLALKLGAVLAVTGIAAAVVFAPDPKLVEYRDQVVLQQEPTGSVTIEDARAKVESDSSVVPVSYTHLTLPTKA